MLGGPDPVWLLVVTRLAGEILEFTGIVAGMYSWKSWWVWLRGILKKVKILRFFLDMSGIIPAFASTLTFVLESIFRSSPFSSPVAVTPVHLGPLRSPDLRVSEVKSLKTQLYFDRLI